MYHERNHWYKLGNPASQHLTSFKSSKHFKCSTYNVLIEGNNGETTYDAFDENFADDPVTRTDCSKYQALLVMTGWIHFCFSGLYIWWYKFSSSLNRLKGKTQSKAEADTWMHGNEGLYGYDFEDM
jgi:hypothetical protein